MKKIFQLCVYIAYFNLYNAASACQESPSSTPHVIIVPRAQPRVKRPSIISDKQQQLRTAALEGNADAVEKILSEEKIDVNFQETKKLPFGTPLAGAWARYSQIVNKPGNDELKANYAKVFKLLIDAGADKSLLEPAHRQGVEKAVKTTLNTSQQLHNAAMNGDAEDVAKILSAGNVDVNAQNKESPHGNTLVSAWLGYTSQMGQKQRGRKHEFDKVEKKYAKIFKLLLDAGVNTEEFVKAVSKGNAAFLRIHELAEQQANEDAPGILGY